MLYALDFKSFSRFDSNFFIIFYKIKSWTKSDSQKNFKFFRIAFGNADGIAFGNAVGAPAPL